MGRLKFDINNLEEIITRGFSMDQIIILTWIQEETILDISSRGVKIQALYQSLIRKGLIDKDKLTSLGEDLLMYFKTKDPTKLIKKRIPVEKHIDKSSDFDKWWSTWPKNDSFDYKEMHFEGDRGFKVNENMCRVKFAEILSEGDYTAEDLINTLKFDVLKKKEASIRERTNKLKFLQNSLTYLNQRTYNAYIEDVKAGAKIIETLKPSTGGGTDI
jgi:hypothetical protein